MKNLPLKELRPGMVVADAIFTSRGQLVMEEGTVLTAELISRLSFYSIYNAPVQIPEDEQDTAAPSKADSGKPSKTGSGRLSNAAAGKTASYSSIVKSQPEFWKYQIAFHKELRSVKNIFQAIVQQPDSPIDFQQILDEISALVISCRTTVDLFDKIHNMRQDEDSVYAHSLNVALISRMMGRWLRLSARDRDVLTLCGLLHDIGKLSIPQEILDKPDKYTDEEFKLIQQHPLFSYKILKNLPIDERIKNAALQHHERWDGSGYPQGLAGGAVDDFAAIVAIADVYDATTAARSYRPPVCPFQAIASFERDGLQKYHPKYILTFLNRIAVTYQHNRILLNNGQSANIVMINGQNLTRPMIQMDDGSVIDMMDRPDLEITKIV